MTLLRSTNSWGFIWLRYRILPILGVNIKSFFTFKLCTKRIKCLALGLCVRFDIRAIDEQKNKGKFEAQS